MTTVAEQPDHRDDSGFSGDELAKELETQHVELTEDEIEDRIDQELENSELLPALQEERLEAVKAGSKEREVEAVQSIRTLRHETRLRLFPELAEAEAGMATIMSEKQQARIKRIQDVFGGLNGTESDEGVLLAMHMLDGEGKFHYPLETFSEMTDEAWGRYMEIIKEHEQLGLMAREGDGDITLQDITLLDRRRRRLHNELTRSMLRDLGLESDGEGEDFYQVRSLAAKMAEARYPNTGELAISVKLPMRLLKKNREEDAQSRHDESR